MTAPGDVPAPPFEDAYWVVRGELMAGPHPGGRTIEETAHRLSLLTDAGIRRLINLTLPHEERAEQRYEVLIGAAAASTAVDVQAIRFSLFDGSCPSEGAVVELLDAVDACLAAGRPAYVHCMQGLGRTGVAVGCYLVRHERTTPRRAIGAIRRLRSTTRHAHHPSPLTDEQVARVRTWRPGR
jgi:predicted protein tyrosine phosphatase